MARDKQDCWISRQHCRVRKWFGTRILFPFYSGTHTRPFGLQAAASKLVLMIRLVFLLGFTRKADLLRLLVTRRLDQGSIRFPESQSALFRGELRAWPSPPAASAPSAPSPAPSAPSASPGSASRPSAPGTGGSARGLKRKGAGNARKSRGRQCREPHGAASSAAGLSEDNSKQTFGDVAAGDLSGLLRAPVRGDGRGASRLGADQRVCTLRI